MINSRREKSNLIVNLWISCIKIPPLLSIFEGYAVKLRTTFFSTSIHGLSAKYLRDIVICSISVKLWSTDMEHSVACLEAKANVCCVKFNPESRYHLSFGSAGMNLKQVEKVNWHKLTSRMKHLTFLAMLRLC